MVAHECFWVSIPVHHGKSESAVLGAELECQARNAAEFLVGDGGCPAADLFGVVDSDDDVESVEREVEEASLVAKLATDLQQSWPVRRVELPVPRAAVSSQSGLVDPVAQFRRKLEKMRLSVLGEEAAGSRVVLRHHSRRTWVKRWSGF